MGPAYEQLFEENKQPKTRLSELEKLVLSLQEQLKLNSKNSSKPVPSNLPKSTYR